MCERWWRTTLRALAGTCKWVMSHVWTSHGTHMNGLRERWWPTTSRAHTSTCEWVMSFMSHIWMSHVPRMNESWHTYKWVMSHMWMSHVTHMTESCHTYEWVTAHTCMSHVTPMKYSWDLAASVLLQSVAATHFLSKYTAYSCTHIHILYTFIFFTHSYSFVQDIHVLFAYIWVTSCISLHEPEAAKIEERQ